RRARRAAPAGEGAIEEIRGYGDREHQRDERGVAGAAPGHEERERHDQEEPDGGQGIGHEWRAAREELYHRRSAACGSALESVAYGEPWTTWRSAEGSSSTEPGRPGARPTSSCAKSASWPSSREGGARRAGPSTPGDRSWRRASSTSTRTRISRFRSTP